MSIHIEICCVTAEDYDLLEYVKLKICEKPPFVSQTIRPMNYLFTRMNNKQRKLLLLLLHQPKEECPVCYKNINYKNEVITNCNHMFCSDCINELRNYSLSCPLCRENITTLEFNDINNEYKLIIDFVKENNLFIYFKKPNYSRYPYII